MEGVKWTLFLGFLIQLANTSHFRGAIIMMRPTESSHEREMEISFQIAWRRNYQFSKKCDEDAIKSQTLIGDDNNGELVCLEGCLDTKTGLTMGFYCSDFSITENWSYGGRHMDFNFTGPGNQALIVFKGENWLAPFHTAWYIATSNNLSKRNDTGKINSTPRAIISPVVRLKENCNHTISIPVSDPDDDIVRCRWGQGSDECAKVCDKFPSAVLDSDSCTITYEAKYGAGPRIAAIMIEDFLSDSDIPLSSVSLQFVIEIYSSGQSCFSSPRFIPPTIASGSCVAIPPNNTFSTQLIASSGQESVDVKEILTVSPAGLVKSPIYHASDLDVFHVNITWLPKEDQLDQTHGFCYSAVDSDKTSTEQNCIKLMAGSYPPSIIHTYSKRNVQGKHQLEIQFDQPIKNSDIEAEISFKDYEENTLLHRINTLKSKEVAFHHEHNMTIIPEFVFPENRKVFVELERNVVVGVKGCNPGNEPIRDKDFWNFFIDDVTPPIATFVNLPSKINRKFTFEWTTNEPAQTMCNLDFKEMIDCSQGVFEADDLTEGRHVLFMQHTDQNNNTANTTIDFFVDLTAPRTSFEKVPSTVSNERRFTFFFACDEPTKDCLFYCNFHNSSTKSTNQNLCSGNSFTTPSLENEVQYVLSVYAIDSVNNIGNVSSYQWTVDLTPPSIFVNDESIQCSAYNKGMIEFANVLDNLDPNPKITFTDSKNSCVVIRTWEATDEAGNRADLEQKLTILFNPSLMMLSSLSLPCPSELETTGLSTDTASAPNPCKRPLVMSHTDHPKVPVCPGQVNRTWSLRDTCTGKEVQAQQFITFYDECPLEACGQNYSQPHGLCSQGKCLCKQSWNGETCNIFIQMPKIKPVESRSLLEYQDYEANLTLLQGTEPISWNILSAPYGTRIEYSTEKVLLQRAPAGNLTFTITARNQVGKDKLTMKAVVKSTYSAYLNALINNQISRIKPIILTGTVSYQDESPIRDLLQGNVPVVIDIENPTFGGGRTLNVFTDQNSQFSVTYYPGSLVYGKFEASARHPSEPKGTPQIEWMILGMSTHPKSVSLYGETNGPYRNVFSNISILINDGPADLHLIRAKPTPREIADFGVTLIVTFGQGEDTVSTLTSGSKVAMNIALETTRPLQFRYPIVMQTKEGVTSSVDIDVNIKQILPVYHIDPPKIETSITRGSQKSVEFETTNLGEITAENVRLSLPDSSLFAVSSFSLSNDNGNVLTLGSQDTAKASVLVTIPDDQPLGIISGSFYINSKLASAVVPFSILVASDNYMNLTIVVEDEYTYFADGNPLVSDAMITLINTRRGIQLTRSTSENEGSTTFTNLPEERYEVSVEAPEHKGRKEILITSLTKPRMTLFLEREAVTIRWSVIQTEFKDVYDITLEADYKVNVPMPVLSITPNEIDLEEYKQGLKDIIQFNVTNHGLIRADDIDLNLPSGHQSLRFIFLSEVPKSIDAKQSVIILVQVSHKKRQKRADNCPVYGGGLIYAYVCSGKQVRSVPILFKENCVGCDISSCTFTLTGGILGGSGSSGLGHINPIALSSIHLCDFNKDCLWAVIGCLPIPIKIPIGKGIKKQASKIGLDYSNGGDIYNCAILVASGTDPLGSVVNALKYVSCVGDKYDLPGTFFCIYDFMNECIYKHLPKDHSRRKRSFIDKEISEELATERIEDFVSSASALFYSVRTLEEILGSRLWLLKGDPSWVDSVLIPVFQDSSELGHLVSPNELQSIKNSNYPEGITWEATEQLVNRFNSTLMNWEIGNLEPSDDNKSIISHSFVETSLHNLSVSNEIAKERGFASYVEAYKSDYDKLLQTDRVNREDGVCAIVRIQIKQKATLTRVGFVATLDIENKEKSPLKDIRVEIVITDKATFQLATERFAIGTPTLSGPLSGTDGNGTLPRGSSGTSEWLIIPYSEAAPTSSVLYDIKGTLSYTTGDNKVEIPLHPTPITVHSDPSLVVHYFWEKYVISDDPFTDEVEPAVPFSLGVMIKNEGFGTAYSMRITSAQPEIIENEKGLLISFKMIKSMLGNKERSPSLTVDFEDILPNVTKTARWWMTSSLIGKFINYNATFENKNPLGDPKLSLIDNLTVHELIQNVRIPGDKDDGVLDFLVNDEKDPYSIPDKIYSSKDMSSLPVKMGNITGSTYRKTEQIYLLELEVETGGSGWYYYSIVDPVFDSLPVGNSVKLSRQDVDLPTSTIISLPTENAWISVDVLSKKRKKALNIIDHNTENRLSKAMYVVEICENCLAAGTSKPPEASTPSEANTPPNAAMSLNFYHLKITYCLPMFCILYITIHGAFLHPTFFR